MMKVMKRARSESYQNAKTETADRMTCCGQRERRMQPATAEGGTYAQNHGVLPSHAIGQYSHPNARDAVHGGVYSEQ